MAIPNGLTNLRSRNQKLIHNYHHYHPSSCNVLGGRLEIPPQENILLLLYFLTKALKQIVCFFEAAPCTVGSRWSGHNLLGFVDQGVETRTAIDPGSIAEKKGSGTRLGSVFFCCEFQGFLFNYFFNAP